MGLGVLDIIDQMDLGIFVEILKYMIYKIFIHHQIKLTIQLSMPSFVCDIPLCSLKRIEKTYHRKEFNKPRK